MQYEGGNRFGCLLVRQLTACCKYSKHLPLGIQLAALLNNNVQVKGKRLSFSTGAKQMAG
jgi:hypothetical protein